MSAKKNKVINFLKSLPQPFRAIGGLIELLGFSIRDCVALLIGITIGMGSYGFFISCDFYPSKKNKMTLKANDGKFEWQWAGENWLGYMEFKNDSEEGVVAKINVDKIFKEKINSNEYEIVRLPGIIKSSNNSFAPVKLKGNMVLIENMPVDFSEYGENKSINKFSYRGFLNIKLKPTPAFEGIVEYITGEHKSTGNIALIAHSWKP